MNLTYTTTARTPLAGASRSHVRRMWGRVMDQFEPVVEILIRICGWSAIFFVLAIFVFVFIQAAPVLDHLSLKEFFTSSEWVPTPSEGEPAHFGIFILLIGTLSVSIVAMLIAVPFGLGAAIYISEFSTGKT